MSEPLYELIGRMNSRRAAVRREAVQAALALPQERLLELAELVAIRHPNRLQQRARQMCGVLSLLALTPLILYWAVNQDRHAAVIMLPAAAICIGFAALMETYDQLIARTELADVMMQRANLSFLLPAVELLQKSSTGKAERRLRRNLQGMLKHILSKVHAGDGPNINHAEREALNRLLANPYEDLELTLSVLKALQQVGDATALPYVRRLSTLPIPLRWKMSDKRYKATKIAEVRRTAADCLPLLTAQIERTRQSQTLLRPAQTQPFAPESLLRPAAPTNRDTSPEQLLRSQSAL